MGRIWQWVKRGIGALGDVQAIAAIIPAGVLSAVGGVSGYLESGLGWGLFMASGVFCFITVGYFVTRANYRANRLEHKLNVTGINLVQQPVGNGVLLYRPSFMLHNLAPFEVFYEMKHGVYHFDGVTQVPVDQTLVVSGLLAPQDTGNIVLSGGHGAPSSPKGRMVIEIHYGRQKDELTHSFKTTLYCTSTSFFGEHEGAHVMLRNIENMDYAPLGKTPRP